MRTNQVQDLDDLIFSDSSWQPSSKREAIEPDDATPCAWIFYI